MLLNLTSLLGLLVMIGIAWCLSSRRTQVDWRLVILGVGLQLLFAAVFFNSQNWKFSARFHDLDSLVLACDQERIPVDHVPMNLRGEPPLEFAEVYARYRQNEMTVGELMRQPWVQVPAADTPLDVPRFKNGVVFYAIESFFDVIKRSVDHGARFVFNVNAFPEEGVATRGALLSTFAFGVLPTVIFFASLMSVLYYLGVMQKLIRIMAKVMEVTLRTSPAESLAAAANVLVGHTEAPLVVKPYIPTMTRSELNALMVGGFATISGSLMAVFAGMGISAGHLLTASIISAPAALLIAKILQPETEEVTELSVAEARMQANATNVIEAAANGASEGVKLAINIAAMLIAFLALIMFVDIILQGIGSWFGLNLSLGLIFGYLFFPLAWIMGIAADDCLVAGDLLGQKMVVNEFLAYASLADVPPQGKTLVDPEGITDRSRVILTYALCGFSNFGAIGIQLGGIGPLAPARKSDLAQLGLRAMLGGMLAACMTACIAGMFLNLPGLFP